MEVMNIVWIVVIVLAVIHGLKGALTPAKAHVRRESANPSRPVTQDENEDAIDTYIREGDPESDPSRAGSAAYNAQEALDRMGH